MKVDTEYAEEIRKSGKCFRCRHKEVELLKEGTKSNTIFVCVNSDCIRFTRIDQLQTWKPKPKAI